jgi:hypothetical protein
MAALVGPHSVDVDSRRASSISLCLAARASPRWASSEAKCVPRRRPKASRAAAKRDQRASSVLRSIPRIDFHSSTMAFSRSPAAFHAVDSAAICSASTASASLRATWTARAAAFSARDSAAAESAVPTIARARAASPSRSPTAAAEGIASASACALAFSSAGLPVCAFSRASRSDTSVARSS